MDKPLIRQERSTSWTHLLHKSISNDTLEMKVRFTTHPYHSSAREPLGQLWDNPLVTLGKTSAWLAWARTRHSLRRHHLSCPVCSSTAWPTPSCLRGPCMSYFHSEFVHFPFSASVSVLLRTGEGPITRMSFPIQPWISLTAHFPWTAREQPSFTQDVAWIHVTKFKKNG